MTGCVGDIEETTVANDSFRSVLFTGKQLQLTVMRLAPDEEIGVERHPDTDQFLGVEQGRARVTFGPVPSFPTRVYSTIHPLVPTPG